LRSPFNQLQPQRADLSADFAGTDSILRLLAADDGAGSSPAGLTDWDRTFLGTLYGIDIPGMRSRRLISSMMFDGLRPD
jgi:hypothetical protein